MVSIAVRRAALGDGHGNVPHRLAALLGQVHPFDGNGSVPGDWRQGPWDPGGRGIPFAVPRLLPVLRVRGVCRVVILLRRFPGERVQDAVPAAGQDVADDLVLDQEGLAGHVVVAAGGAQLVDSQLGAQGHVLPGQWIG